LCKIGIIQGQQRAYTCSWIYPGAKSPPDELGAGGSEAGDG